MRKKINQDYCKSIYEILESEANLSKCINSNICNILSKDLNCICKSDRRIAILKCLLDSSNRRTFALSKLVDSCDKVLEKCNYKCYSKEFCDEILNKVYKNCDEYDLNLISRLKPKCNISRNTSNININSQNKREFWNQKFNGYSRKIFNNNDENIKGVDLGKDFYYLGKVKFVNIKNQKCDFKHFIYNKNKNKLYICNASTDKNVKLVYKF